MAAPTSVDLEEVRALREKSEEAVDALAPSESIEWKVQGADATGAVRERVYYQEEMSFFYKAEFMNMLGRVMDERFLSENSGLNIADLFDSEVKLEIPTELNRDEVQKQLGQSMGMINAFLRLIQIFPDLMKDIFAIALGIPKPERNWAMGILTGPTRTGGLSDDQGFQIIDTFIEQNAEAIRKVFTERLARTAEKARMALRGLDTPGSTPSSTGSQDTPQTESTTSSPGKPESSSSSMTPSSEERSSDS